MSDEPQPISTSNGNPTRDELIVTPITAEMLDRSTRRLAQATADTGHFRPGGLLMPDFPEA